MLGDACNFKCRYCLQGNHENKIVPPVFSQNMLSFLDSYPSDNTMLSFWGGEPLLYFNSIKKLVERYKNKFHYEMVSNGSLLTEEIVTFLNKYNINFNLSHDGKDTSETRLIDVLIDKHTKSLFEKINNRAVNVTITSISPSMKELFEYYPIDCAVNINTMINTTDTEISRIYASFNYDKYKQDIQYLLQSYEDYLSGDKSKWREAKNVSRMMGSFQAFLNEGRTRNRCFACGHGKKMLNMDANGDFYICHNSKTKIGSVKEGLDAAASKLDKILKKTGQKCEICEIKDYCSGSCFMLNGYGEKQNCEMLKHFYQIFLSWLIEAKKRWENKANIS